MFKRGTLDKFTKFIFLKFWNILSETKISKFQKMTEEIFPKFHE